MKRINLTKYGFVRWPEEDFHDDGNNFSGFRAGKNVRVSKLVSDGQVYLSISSDNCGNGTLPYEVYSKLPYYNEATWKYNGVAVDSLTDDDLQAFYGACISYEKAYEEAEANIKYPTMEEITEQCKKISLKTLAEIDEIEKIIRVNRLTELAVRFSAYDWEELQECLVNLTKKLSAVDVEAYPARIYKTHRSFNFVSPTNSDLARPNYWYERAMNLFKKYKFI